MADILPFKKPTTPKKRQAKKGNTKKGNTLCRQGHHKWKIVTEKKFDVKQGKLITVFECAYCGKRKVKAL